MEFNLTPKQRENVERWCDELESGRWRQGDGMLLAEASDGTDLYCCLGVACAVEGIPATESAEEQYMFSFPQGTILWAAPDEAWFEETFGFSFEHEFRPLPGKLEPARATYLSALNDHHGYTFEDIARVLREQVLGQVPAEKIPAGV